MDPEYDESGIRGIFADKMGLSDSPSFPVPLNSDQQREIRTSGYQDSPSRDQFYEPGAAGFADRLAMEYNYPASVDPETGAEVFDMGGADRLSRPADRQDLPTPQEMEDARKHMLGTALMAKGYGPETATRAGGINEVFFGFHQGRRDKEMDYRNNAVGLSLFKQAGIDASAQQLTQMVDDAIFRQLDRIMARPSEDRSGPPGVPYNSTSPSDGPDLYFPRDARGNFDTKN
tara:strand:- start:4028 stop:4720 length:693 start_codon:yes stop_codon:yes gene_type:complete